MQRDEIINWLLEGDVAIQYQTHRDLINAEPEVLKQLKVRIPEEGWGKAFLERQKPEGHWGDRFYQPKWISTHYTLLDLRNLCIVTTPQISYALSVIFKTCMGRSGELYGFGGTTGSDVCVNGMFLNYASYFGASEGELEGVIEFLIREQMSDGGYNCMASRSGAKHSSLHSTLSVLEGIWEYRLAGNTYRVGEMQRIEKEAQEFLLMHQLFRSDHTGEVINPALLRLPYPSRWKYDILRALDYFRHAGVPYDPRMSDAFEVLESKRTKAGLWKLNAAYPGAVHFEMETAGQPSRWNTLRALRVLDYYKG